MIISSDWESYVDRMKGDKIMSDKERAMQLLNAVPDYKMGYVIAYLQDYFYF